MTVNECYLYVQDGLNKISTNASQNISKSAFVRTFNAVQLQWVEDRIKLNEVNNVRIDELQYILKQENLNVVKKDLYYESNLPEDYFHFRRAYCNSGECSLNCWFTREADVNILLQDEFWKPSKEWGETFCTFIDNKIRVYHNNEFNISSTNLIYYRFPIEINMADGYEDINGNPTVDVDSEFKGSSLIEILNMTIQHLAGNINDQFRYQVYGNKIQTHT